MGFRPTISVYLNGQILDVWMYKNCLEKWLFYKALSIAADYDHCKSIEDYRRTRLEQVLPEYRYLIEERKFDAEDIKEMDSFEAGRSEFPLIVDLTNKTIYYGPGARSKEELRQIPSIFDRFSNDELWDKYESALPFGTYLFHSINFPGYSGPLDEPVHPLTAITPESEFDFILRCSRIPYAHIDLPVVKQLYHECLRNST